MKINRYTANRYNTPSAGMLILMDPFRGAFRLAISCLVSETGRTRFLFPLKPKKRALLFVNPPIFQEDIA